MWPGELDTQSFKPVNSVATVFCHRIEERPRSISELVLLSGKQVLKMVLPVVGDTPPPLERGFTGRDRTDSSGRAAADRLRGLHHRHLTRHAGRSGHLCRCNGCRKTGSSTANHHDRSQLAPLSILAKPGPVCLVTSHNTGQMDRPPGGRC